MRHVFAGVRVSDLAVSADWFERLLGRGASFVPNDTELVWDHSDGGSVFIELSTEGAGFSRVTLFVDDLDDFLGGAAGRGIEPVRARDLRQRRPARHLPRPRRQRHQLRRHAGCAVTDHGRGLTPLTGQCRRGRP